MKGVGDIGSNESVFNGSAHIFYTFEAFYTPKS
jgi:hypothetical protein